MTERLRVLWLTPDKPDNISVGRGRIATHLEEFGCSVTVRGTTPRTLLRSMTEHGRYDVIVGTTRAGAFAGVILKFLHGRPLLVDHVDPIRQFEETHPRWLAFLVRWMENISFRLSNYTLFVYDDEQERVERHARDCSRTDLGVDFDRFAKPSEDSVRSARERLQRYSLSDDVALYVGGLEPIYNIVNLLEAFTLLPGWSLVIIGDGSLREEVINAEERFDNVHYLGTVPHGEVPGFTHLADVGISLVDDANTLKILEYGAAGLPVVQLEGDAETRFGAHLEYCSLRPEDIAETVRESKESSDDRLQSVVRDYDWESIAEKYFHTIQQIR